jgi:hypothetical protein
MAAATDVEPTQLRHTQQSFLDLGSPLVDPPPGIIPIGMRDPDR